MSRHNKINGRRFVLVLNDEEYEWLIKAAQDFDSKSQFLRWCIKNGARGVLYAGVEGTQGGAMLQLKSVSPALGIADNERYR